MKPLLAIVALLLAVSACGPASPPPSGGAGQTAAPTSPAKPTAGKTDAPATAAPTAAVAATAAATSKSVDGIRVTVDGKVLDLTGEVQVTRQSGGGATALKIGKNAQPSALTTAYGVLLELQTTAKNAFQDGFAVGDIKVATFTVWKGAEFSYMSTGAMPGKGIQGLVYSQESGKITGSYEDNLSGPLGKMHAVIEFGVAAPK